MGDRLFRMVKSTQIIWTRHEFTNYTLFRADVGEFGAYAYVGAYTYVDKRPNGREVIWGVNGACCSAIKSGWAPTIGEGQRLAEEALKAVLV